MALWVDRTADVEGPGLHALVIGVSDYRFLPEDGQFPDPKHFTLGLTKVSIPATGAFRVATWLRDHYWHPEVKIKTIDLLLSPHAKEITPETNPPKGEVDEMRARLAAEAGTLARPDTLNVEQALKSWRRRCEGQPGDVALLYVSGHGIQWGSKDDAIVLLEDFGESEDLFLKRAIDIGRTMKGMAGDEMPQTQLYFVDACQIQPDEHASFEDAGDPVRLSSKFGITDLRSAPIYFGAVSQSAAKGKNGTGYLLRAGAGSVPDTGCPRSAGRKLGAGSRTVLAYDGFRPAAEAAGCRHRPREDRRREAGHRARRPNPQGGVLRLERSTVRHGGARRRARQRGKGVQS